MQNPLFQVALAASIALAFSCSVPAVCLAQQSGANSDTAADADSGTGGIGSLDADTAFSAVERGDTIGATSDTGSSFSAASTTNTDGGGGFGAGGLGGGGLGGLGGFGNLFGNQSATSQRSTPIIRTRLRSAVKVPPMAPAQIQQAATLRFRSLPATESHLRGVSVVVQQGGTAVIHGTVSRERDRRMSELLMRLEPGVRGIDNRVIVLPSHR